MADDQQKPDPTPDLQKTNEALMARIDALEKRLEAKTPEPPTKDDDDLTKKAEALRGEERKKADESKALEAALKFSLNAEQWLKNNETLLPQEIKDIFTAAEKENFDNAIEKDQAIKSGIIQSFFKVQANFDLLTQGQKVTLENFLKLTKNGKQEKAAEVFDMIFEPALETVRREKKAEALAKGHSPDGGFQEAYKKKLMDLSKKHYLREQ